MLKIEMEGRPWILQWILVISFSCVDKSSCAVTNLTISGSHVSGGISEGSPVSITCRASCDNGTCNYVWELANTANIARWSIQPTTGTYSIASVTNVNRTDAGTYICKVKDTDEVEKTNSYSLTVYYGPDAVTLDPLTQGYTLSESTDRLGPIDCRIDNCYPPENCSSLWTYPDGYPTSYTTNNTTLDISRVNRSHDGMFICSGINSKTNITKMTSIKVTINYGPDSVHINDSTSRSVTVVEGSPYAAVCSCQTCAPGCSVEWRHAGQITGRQGELQFRSISRTNKGQYSCTCTNTAVSAKKVSKTLNLDIQYGPTLLETQSDYNVSKGSSLNMTVMIYAVPNVKQSDVSVTHSNDTISLTGITVGLTVTPEGVHFYNTDIHVNVMTVKVHITEVKEEYFGDIIVEMRNKIGQNSIIITLHPQGPPDPPANITLFADVYSVAFRLKPGFFNGANQTFYVEHSTNRDASAWNNETFVEAGFRKADDYFKDVTVKGLQPETTYYFRLKGVNIYGESEPTEILEVKTLEEPLNWAAIAGGAAAGAVIVIIVIVICVLKRRGSPPKKTSQPIPMTNILDVPTSDQAPIIARSPYTYSATGNTNSVLYENTLAVTPDGAQPAPSSPNEHIYGNTDISVGGEHSATPFQYNNAPDNKNTITELNRQESTEPHYSNYSNQRVSNESKKTDGERTQNDFEGDDIPGEQPYLDMELGKGPNKTEEAYLEMEVKKNVVTEEPYLEMEVKKDVVTEEPYLEMEVQRNGQDYMNVEKYKKSNKRKRKEPKKSEELQKNESTHQPLRKRESMPDYVAPPPPQAGEEDYMNLDVNRKS